MNGTPEQNFPEAGSTGAYPGAYAENPGSYAADPAAAQYSSAGYGSAPGSSAPADAYAAPGSVPPPPGAVPPGYVPPYGAPAPPPLAGPTNPGLATLLGFIPGVGAMYNGQFAKGIAHIVIFSILTSLSSHAHEPLDVIAGLLTAGWYFYMVLDAYQTARARRDGLVAPDPFGLNNIGERFGLPANPNWGDFVARPPAGGTVPGDARTSNPYAGPPTDPATGSAATGYSYAGPAANSYGYAPNQAATPYGNVAPGSYPPPPPYAPGTVPPPWHPEYPEAFRRQAAVDAGVAPNPAYQATYAPYDPAAMPPIPASSGSSIPTGAIWLIGLGVLALAGSLAHNFYWRGSLIASATCFIFGAVLLVQQTSVTRRLYQRGTAAYQWNLLHQARFGLLLIVVGIFQTLEGLYITSWHYLWPYLLIFFGLLQLANRMLYNRMLLEPPVFANGYAPVNASTAAAAPNAPAAEATTSTTEGEVR